MENIRELISTVVRELYGQDIDVVLTRPDEQFGDYATNVALQLAGKTGKNPREIADEIAARLQGEFIAKVEVAGPGFINITLTDQASIKQATAVPAQAYVGMNYVVEYSCPNYFKELHAGHLYQTLAGDVIAKLLESAGANVHRANFGGDVGLHVAKAIYGMNKSVNGAYNNQDFSKVLQHMRTLEQGVRPAFLASSYVLGSRDYESDVDRAKYWVEDLNGELYSTVFSEVAEDYADQASKDQREVFYLGQEWSRQYFDLLYSELKLRKQPDGTFFDYFPESKTAGVGKDLVWANIIGEAIEPSNKSIFVRSEAAVVFPGEEHGLHTRVFITKQGYPTYEAKDLGLIFIELEKYKELDGRYYDRRVLITGNDQAEYMKVVWKAADLLEPGLANKMTHLTNGTIRFGDGKKMSSRLGNVTRAVDVLETVRKLTGDNEEVALGAVKYEFLKYRLGGDIAFDPEESVSLEGNSGPYLQYAHARARSILGKVTTAGSLEGELQPDERSLLRKIGQYAEVVEQATTELMPHHICTYLYELAQKFNSFYEHNRVIGDERQEVRLSLVQKYADTLKRGLELLGIHAPDHM